MILPFDQYKQLFIFEATAYQFENKENIHSYLDNLEQNRTNDEYPIVILLLGFPYCDFNPTHITILNRYAQSIPNPILFCTGALGPWIKDIESRLEFKVSTHRYFEWEAKLLLEKQNLIKNLEFTTNKDKKFLFASTKQLPERKQLLDSIINKGFFNHGYVGSPETGRLDDHLEWVRMDTQYRTNSYVHIITDTFYQTPRPGAVFLSKKIFTAMAYGQMFIYLGPAYTLEYLRNEGYETFSDFIDEDYDKIYEPNDRLRSVIESVLEFIAKPKDEIEEIYTKCMPKLLKNKEKFLNSDYKNLILQDLVQAQNFKNK